MTIRAEEQPYFIMDGEHLPAKDERVCLQISGSNLATMGYIGIGGYWYNSSGKRIKSHLVTGWRYPYWAAN